MAGEERWYVIMTHERREAVALLGLERQGFHVRCPMTITKRLERGKVVEAKEPVFPEYLLVRMNIAEEPWKRINGTRGVVKLLPLMREQPQPLPRGWYEQFEARVSAGEFVVDTTARRYGRGERVEVTSGPLLRDGSTVVGICHHHRGTRVKLLLACFGGQTMVDVPLQLTRPAA